MKSKLRQLNHFLNTNNYNEWSKEILYTCHNSNNILCFSNTKVNNTYNNELYYGDANSYIYVSKEAYWSKCSPDQKILLEAYKIYISENGTLEAQNLKSIDLVKKRYLLTDRQCPGKFQKGIFNNYVIKSSEL